MTAVKVLVPYNFSIHDWKAFDFIISVLAGKEDARVSIFNAYPPVPEIDLTANPELTKMKSGLLYLSEELKRKEEGLKIARDYFLKRGFSDSQVDIIFKKKEKNIADEIIETVLKGRYNIVVLTPTPGKVSKLFARSVHDKILSTLKDATVCIPT
jgi:hypothetical protein